MPTVASETPAPSGAYQLPASELLAGCSGPMSDGGRATRERAPASRSNVVDLMTLQSPSQHHHGLADADFDVLFTKDKPVVFHGYLTLIHQLTYRRTNYRNLHVGGYEEEGTTTTPFDMVVLNGLARFHLVEMVIDRMPSRAPGKADRLHRGR
jgi:phosphoketolase